MNLHNKLVRSILYREEEVFPSPDRYFQYHVVDGVHFIGEYQDKHSHTVLHSVYYINDTVFLVKFKDDEY